MVKVVNGIVSLDLKDKKILYQLDFNGRMPLSQLSKKVALSEEVTNYRLKNLIKLGVIEYLYPVVDFYRIGYNYIKFLFRLKKISIRRKQELVEHLKKIPGSAWITSGDGKFDVHAGFFVKKISKLQEIYNDIMFKFCDLFIEIIPSIGIRIHHFKHKYLYGTEDCSSIIMGEEPQNIKVDKIEKDILDLLYKNGRKSLVDLSKELGISSNSIKNKIKNMERNEIIRGYKFKLNIRRLGYEQHKIYLYFNKINSKKLNEIITYLSYQPSIIFITQSIGRSMLEFEAIVKNRVELHKFFRQLESRFENVIFDYNTVLFYDQHSER